MGIPAYAESAVNSSEPSTVHMDLRWRVPERRRHPCWNYQLVCRALGSGRMWFQLPDIDQFRAVVSEPFQNTDNNRFSGSPENKTLVLEHFRQVCMKASDVRFVEANTLSRLAIDSDLWNLKVVIQFCWKEAAFINGAGDEVLFFNFPFVASPLQAKSLDKILVFAGFASQLKRCYQAPQLEHQVQQGGSHPCALGARPQARSGRFFLCSLSQFSTRWSTASPSTLAMV